MAGKLSLCLFALMPALAFPDEDPAATTGTAQSEPIELRDVAAMNLEQLCSARDDPDVWDELERREVFNSRELRDIRRGEVRKGISEEALICSRGLPEHITPAVAYANAFGVMSRDRVEAYIYPPEGDEILVAYVRHAAGESVVVHTMEPDAAEAFAAVATTKLVCDGSQGATRCSIFNDTPSASGCGIASSPFGSGSGAVTIPSSCGAPIRLP